jgi:hypothetical protein
MTQSENAVLLRELAEARELLRSRRNRQKGKRVALQREVVFSTQEVLENIPHAIALPDDYNQHIWREHDVRERAGTGREG